MGSNTAVLVVVGMALSARNRLDGTVQSIETDGIMAEVTIETTGGQTVTAVITTSSVERLGIAEGDEVNAVIKATEVMVENE
ncbi:molybdate transport system regulatory protein [Natrinema hispanicum]|uniref:Molybdate transport system regulatory protein n=2 Tax=Natrinema hispanicum TaxID=392421 RepID=A0A1G6KWH6_9EURY|nr:molybdate transport system regulatory protein [Natrinema hispanicum]SET05752.1 molybdenum-pterin binding domain-containing protein [Natrinema hispanicum]